MTDPPAWSARPDDPSPDSDADGPDGYRADLEASGVPPKAVERMVTNRFTDPTVEEYLPLNEGHARVLDLHGSRARRRHIAAATIRLLGYDLAETPSDATLVLFAGIGSRLAELAGRQVSVESTARAIASVQMDDGDLSWLEADLGLSGETHRASRHWRLLDVRQELFVRVRRVLRALAAQGVVNEFGDA